MFRNLKKCFSKKPWRSYPLWWYCYFFLSLHYNCPHCMHHFHCFVQIVCSLVGFAYCLCLSSSVFLQYNINQIIACNKIFFFKFPWNITLIRKKILEIIVMVYEHIVWKMVENYGLCFRTDCTVWKAIKKKMWYLFLQIVINKDWNTMKVKIRKNIVFVLKYTNILYWKYSKIIGGGGREGGLGTNYVAKFLFRLKYIIKNFDFMIRFLILYLIKPFEISWHSPFKLCFTYIFCYS